MEGEEVRKGEEKEQMKIKKKTTRMRTTMTTRTTKGSPFSTKQNILFLFSVGVGHGVYKRTALLSSMDS